VIPDERMHLLDISATSMPHCVMQWGIGTRDAIASNEGGTG